uniref:Uncharacterized protein n=1 Tax=Avena sativa TaxID=4498 RepID=A0ACD5ZEV0_AVESA
MLRVNALMVVNAILMGVMVGIGAYGHRYRHHPLIRFLFLGATILFLPIVSYILSATSNQHTIAVPSRVGDITVIGNCLPTIHRVLILVWTAFVQIVGINTAAIVAADTREGRSIAPPRESFFFILGISTPFALIFAKIFLKYYAWYNARHSFAFGRNPRLIVGYMEQLPDKRHHAEVASEHTPPPLIVSREDNMLVEKQPCGYRMCNRGDTTRISNKGGLVTIDKVWELDGIHLKSTTQLKDVCFSFALFKMLRCCFAKYAVIEAGFMKAHNFLWHVLLEDSDDKRILGLGIQVGDTFLEACSAKGTYDALLAWHIATSILEVRYPHATTSSFDHKSVATKLSRYCAYLVAYSPEVLPDDDAWSSGMYKATKKDALRVLATAPAATPMLEMEYRHLVELLSTRSKQDVLKDGAKLGDQLVDLMEGEEAAWEALARFWSEAILYIAPSDNLEGHVEAIARGGELITLLWALLTHLGVDPRAEGTSTTTTMDV